MMKRAAVTSSRSEASAAASGRYTVTETCCTNTSPTPR
jgi:hypothetical protein